MAYRRFIFLMAAPYRLVFRAIALTLRAGLHSRPLTEGLQIGASISPPASLLSSLTLWQK